MPKAIFIDYDGKSLTRLEWSRLLGIPEQTIAWRQDQGMRAADILSKVSLRGRKHIVRQNPSKKRPAWKEGENKPRLAQRRTLTFNGRTKSIACWALDLNLSENTILHRLYLHRPLDQVLQPKTKRTGEKRTRKSRRLQATGTPLGSMIASPPTIASPPATRKTPLPFLGETMSVEQWAAELSLPVALILSRMKAGEPVERCLAKEALPTPQPPKRRPGASTAIMRVPSAVDLVAMANVSHP